MVNRIVQNIANPAAGEFAFINFAKTAFASPGANAPTLFNDDGYPTGTLTDNFTMNFTLPSSAVGDTWVLAWDGTLGDATHGLSFSPILTVTSTVRGHVNSGGGGSGSTIFSGTDGYFEFTFASIPSGTNAVSTFIQSGASFSGFANLILCQKQYYSSIKNSGAIWHPSFITRMQTLNFGVLRMMGAVIVSGNETAIVNSKWNYRTPLTALSYKPNTGRICVANAWAGSASKTNQAYSVGTYTDMPGSYTDGEVFMCNGLTAADAPYAVSAVASSGGKVKLTLDPAVVATISNGDPICYSGYNTVGGINVNVGIWTATVLNSTDIELTSGWQNGLASVFSPLYVASATLQSGGSGYAVNDTITGTGGTASQQVIIKVLTVSGGAVVTFSIQNAGSYSVMPSNPVSQGSTSGGGSGATFNLTFGSLGTINTATINCGGRGKIPLLRCGTFPNVGGGGGLSSADLTANNGRGYFIYNALLKACVVSPGSLMTGLNPELSVNLANTLNVDYWYNQGSFATPAYAVSAITYIRDNLSSGLNCVFESKNEPWNFGFSQFVFCQLSGVALNLSNGASNSNEINAWSFIGLATAILGDAIRPIWNATRSPSQLKITLTHWAQSGRVTNFKTYTLDGTLLNAATNSALSAYTGGVSYNAGSPSFSRPVDRCSIISIAPYAFVPKSTGAAIYTAAQNYANGAIETAFASMDSMIHANTDPSAIPVTGLYPLIHGVCTGYDGDRPPGLPNLTMEAYEGFHEWEFPLVADYVTNGVSTSSTVTFNIGSSPAINWTAHGLKNGCRVSFTSTGTLPTIAGSSIGTGEWYVCNASTNAFDLCPETTAPSQAVPSTLGGSPTGTATATAGLYNFDSAVEGWLNSNHAIWWVRYYTSQLINASWSRITRAASLTTEGWEATHRTWAQWPTDLESTPYLVRKGIELYNNGKRRLQW